MKMDFKYSLVIFIAIASLVRGHTLHANREKRQTANINPVEYLRRYGYLRDQHYTSKILPDTAEYKEALKICQNYLKIKVTGIMNEETQEVMNRPRCGCNDVFSIWMNRTTKDRVKRFTEYKPVNFNARTNVVS